jgi:hypothetical protein
MVKPLLARRITENVQRFAAGEPLVGVVDRPPGTRRAQWTIATAGAAPVTAR